MKQVDSLKVFKCLSDKSRISIMGNLMEGPTYVERLAQRLDITPSTVSFHLKKLEDAGLVCSKKEQYYMVYELNQEILERSLKDMLSCNAQTKEVQEQREEAYRKKVIASFFEYNKLKTIPVQKKKARIIYEEIVKQFEIGTVYTEREVNIIIADIHDDFCTIRKNMVEEGLFCRKGNEYWRLQN